MFLCVQSSTLLILNHTMHDEFCIFPWQMIIKAFTSISAVILEAFDVYCEGDFRWNCGYVISYQYYPDIGTSFGFQPLFFELVMYVVRELLNQKVLSHILSIFFWICHWIINISNGRKLY